MEKSVVDKRMRRRGRKNADIPLLIVTLTLVVFGLIMMFSAGFANAIYMFGDGYHYIKDQAVYAVIGIAFMIGISFIDYKILHKFAWPFMFISYGLLVITLFMPAINNAKRWIVVGGKTFQPSEIVKFAVILLFAHIISLHPEKMKKFYFGYLYFGVILAAIAAIMIMEPHISGTIIIMLIGATMIFCGGANKKIFAALFVAAIALGVVAIILIMSQPDEVAEGVDPGKLYYVKLRIKNWLYPFESYADNYQTIQSLIAIGSGGLMGLGLGNSRQKHLYVPEPQNDFVFAIICEELGFVGAVFVIVLFLLFVVRGFSIALNAKDKFGALLATGITAQIGLQAVLNIAVVSNTVPNTGISLPFFSQGGTSLMILLAEVGVLLSVSRYSTANKI